MLPSQSVATVLLAPACNPALLALTSDRAWSFPPRALQSSCLQAAKRVYSNSYALSTGWPCTADVGVPSENASLGDTVLMLEAVLPRARAGQSLHGLVVQ